MEEKTFPINCDARTIQPTKSKIVQVKCSEWTRDTKTIHKIVKFFNTIFLMINDS